MRGPSAPKPPDPTETATAQFDQSFGTAGFNSLLGQVNQRTPFGNLTYSQTGSNTMTNPFTGKPMDVPQYTATQTLDPMQQRLHDQQTKGELGLAKLGSQQIDRLGGLLGRPMNVKDAPSVMAPNLAMAGGGPNLREQLGNAGKITGKIADAGGVRHKIADAGKIKRRVDGAGKVTGQIDNAGKITKTYGTNFSKDRRRVEEALYSRLNPELERGRSRLETQLSNQGIKQGSAAYDRALSNFGQQENDARMQTILAGGQEQSRLTGLTADRAAFENQAQGQRFGQNAARSAFQNEAQGQRFGQNATQTQLWNQAQQQQYGQNADRAQFHNQAQGQLFGQNAAQAQFGNQAQAQRFGQNVTGATFQNDARQQEYANQMARQGFNNQARQQGFSNDRSLRGDYFNEQFAQRNQPFNEIGALLGTGQVQSPMFANTPTPQMPTTDYGSLVNANYDQRLAAHQQQQQMSPLMGGLFGLGTSAIMASDRRLKTDVERVGVWKSLPLYLYRYVWGGPLRIGVMAQDVLRVKPSAVVPFGEFLAVDYGAL